MTIVMIQGPHEASLTNGAADAMQAALSERARSAGQTLVHLRCDTQAQLIERIARIDRGQADLILFDPGRCARDPAALRPVLRDLDVPYIEVHDDGHDRLDPALPGDSGQRVALVSGFGAQGYTLAMSMALETLGCAESENDVHVGT